MAMPGEVQTIEAFLRGQVADLSAACREKDRLLRAWRKAENIYWEITPQGLQALKEHRDEQAG